MKNTSKIIRKADLTKNFSIIPNHIAQSKTLSPNAKSLIIHILSMPNDWYYIKTRFWKETNLGRDAFMTAWKELEKLGYIQSQRIYEGNLARGYDYVISDLPIFGITENQLNRTTDNPKTSKQLNTDYTKDLSTNEEIKKEGVNTNSNYSINTVADDTPTPSFSEIFYSNPNIVSSEYVEKYINQK